MVRRVTSTEDGFSHLFTRILIFSWLWQPDRGPAVPKFGDWDETDPAAAEGYTQLFNLVREEKQSDTGKVPTMPSETSNSTTQKQANENTKVNL